MKFHKDGTQPIFVFGSNLAGIHGAGAAKAAIESYGAVLHRGIGRHGNSYAIPTKDAALKVLPLSEISKYIKQFIEYARSRPELEFFVTAIGTGLAGYKHEEVAPMFKDAPDNCSFPDVWRQYLDETINSEDT